MRAVDFYVDALLLEFIFDGLEGGGVLPVLGVLGSRAGVVRTTVEGILEGQLILQADGVDWYCVVLLEADEPGGDISAELLEVVGSLYEPAADTGAAGSAAAGKPGCGVWGFRRVSDEILTSSGSYALSISH